MKVMFKRLVSLLLVLSISFLCCPLNSRAEENPNNTAFAPAFVSACSDPEELYCDFDIDVNQMHHFEDSVIQLEFDILKIREDEEYTISLSSTLDVTHNISENSVYTAEQNHVELEISVLENAPVQELENLVYEQIILSFLNAEGVIDYSLEITLLNTQYGVFVGFINEDSLFDSYAYWLQVSNYITVEYYEAIIEERITAKPISTNSSSVQTYATTATYGIGV